VRRFLACAVVASVMTLCGCSSRGSHAAAPVVTSGCSTRVAAARQLPGRPATAAVPGPPTAVVGTANGRWAFASVSMPSGGAVAVLALGQSPPRLVRLVSLPVTLPFGSGMALTPDGQLLLVAGGTATAVLSVRALEAGSNAALVGVLADAGAGQFEVAVSADGRYAFVTDETTGGLSVFNLAFALQHGFSAQGVAVGIVPLAYGAVGIAISPDGQQLYVTTLGAYGPHGQLWVIDAARAESGATGAAVLRHVAAGCQPVRVAVSPDGRTVWVTALQSNALLAFSAADLQADPSQALKAAVRVGSEPVGLLLVDGGRVALVANSNRGQVTGTGSTRPQTVSVVNTAAALDHRPALIGAVPAGLFPRDITFDPATGRVLLANFDSDSVEEFPAPAMP
jgi:6-phosphogluconolactonase (cycloisomerase 2 family)